MRGKGGRFRDRQEVSKPLNKYKKIAYIRVSTSEQRHDRQVEGLRQFCDELHIETVSACGHSRPVLDKVLARLSPGDTLVVWDLDRAFRSVVGALTHAETLGRAGCISASPISTSTRPRPPASSSTR